MAKGGKHSGSPRLLLPRGPTAFQSPGDVSQKRRLRPKGRTVCWVLGLLSSLLAAVTWAGGGGLSWQCLGAGGRGT